MSFTRRIDCWDDIPGAISDMQRAGAGHRVPLLQALYQGRIAHLETQRSASPKLLNFGVQRSGSQLCCCWVMTTTCSRSVLARGRLPREQSAGHGSSSSTAQAVNPTTMNRQSRWPNSSAACSWLNARRPVSKPGRGPPTGSTKAPTAWCCDPLQDPCTPPSRGEGCSDPQAQTAGRTNGAKQNSQHQTAVGQQRR